VHVIEEPALMELHYSDLASICMTHLGGVPVKEA
jgi:hypothetical protein